MRLPYLRTFDHLPTHIKAYEERNIDICHKEVARLEGKEDVVAIDEDEDQTPYDAPDREVGLKRTIVCSFGAVKPLSLFATV